jgi:hypothetical protein
MAPTVRGVHHSEVAFTRGRKARDGDEQPSGLFIEFDDAEDDAEDGTQPVEEVSGRAATRWSRIPVRYRVTAALAVLALALGSVAAVRWDRAARQRARERFTLDVVTDRYVPAISSVGLNLGITLVNHGPALVTVVFMQVSQPGLRLAFYPVQVALPVGTPTAFTLVGVFDCRGGAATDASTVEVTVSAQTGTSTVTLPLKAGSVPPDGWQRQRSAFCAPSNADLGFPKGTELP